MKYRKIFDEITKSLPQKKGHEFEKLINKIFYDNKVLISSRFRTADTEQEIDGAIMIFSKIFLVEAKWEKSETLAASKLFSFLGKINSKIDGTLGIFISYNELNPNFINSARNGIRQNCIIIHGKSNIEDIIEEKVNLKEYIEYCYIQASTKNRVDINTSEFLASPDDYFQKKSHTPSMVQDKWLELYDGLTGSMTSSNFTANLLVWFPDVVNISNRIINIYETIPFDSLTREKFKILIEKIIIELNEDFTFNLVQILSSIYWEKIAYEGFIKHLLGNKIKIEKKDRIRIVDNVSEFLNGNWESENRVSMILDVFYDQMEIDEKLKIANLYLDIYCDNRRLEKFEQKKFSNKVFKDLITNEPKFKGLIKGELINRLKSLKLEEFFYQEEVEEGEEEENSKYLKKITFQRMIEKYGKIIKEIGIESKAFFEEEYQKL